MPQSKKPLALAKLSRPRLHHPVDRERLFELIDGKREYPVVWIHGPPGAGKTTLAASYLEEAAVPAVWYQIDAGDGDPATFFLFLKQAVEATTEKKANPLPSLSREYLPDLPGFAQRFLRAGFAQLPNEAILVFDNYHELAADSALHAAFKAALLEVPPGSNVIVLSRSGPPPAFADALVNQTIALVSWEELRLTPDETNAIGRSRGMADQDLLRALHEQSNGWIAGVTLMLERLCSGGSLQTLARGEGLDTVFDYFAGLVFEDAAEETREVLMKSAYLPYVSAALLEAVTGKAGGIRHIEDLHHRRLFTDRNVGDQITYQFHALFRMFLKSHAAAVYSITQRHELARRAASALSATGHAADAFALYVEAEDWDEAERTLLDSAPGLIRQARCQTLIQWALALPQARVVASPWVGYWLGRSKNMIDPVAARPVVEAAYQTFAESGDEVGQLLCATTMVESIYFEYENFRPMEPWIERIVALLERGVRPSTTEDDLRANSAVVIGATMRAPVHSMLKSCLRRVEDLLNQPFDADTKVTAASMLHNYVMVSMDPDAERIANLVARPLLDSPHLSPYRALHYLNVEGYTHYLYGRYAQALECFGVADALQKENAFPAGKGILAEHNRGLCERRSGRLDLAEETIRRIENRRSCDGQFWKGGLYSLKAQVAFERRDISRAIENMLASHRCLDAAGSFHNAVTTAMLAANMAIAGNRFDVAEQLLARLRHEEYGTTAENYLASVSLNEAWLAHRMGDSCSRDMLLGEAMRRAPMEGARARLRWYGNALAELLPIAVAIGIEAETARSLAQEFSVVPHPLDTEDWPWPVKVYTLGRFELFVNGESPEYSRKVPKKVLSLLKAIIAFGSRDVPEQKLLDALWPEQDGDAASRSLIATLHRLRKLLGDSMAIRQSGGEIALDRHCCWIDVQAFDERLGATVKVDRIEHAIALYRGAFLAEELNAPWAIPVREQLRAKFILGVGKLGSSLEAASRYEAAIDLYLRGIEADGLVEPFYQGLMRCYDGLNRRTEAVSAYRRLREVLSVTLGIPPSAATQRLFEALRLN